MIDFPHPSPTLAALNAETLVDEQRHRMRVGAELLALARGCGHVDDLTVCSGNRKIAEVLCDEDGRPLALLVSFAEDVEVDSQ